MTARTITVTLTKAQYRALGAAVAVADGEDEVSEALDPYRRGQAIARENAWVKIRNAWYDRERR